MDFLYGKIGGKLKGLAIASAIIGAIASVISGSAMISENEDMAGWGLLIIFGGVVASWILSLVVYDIGEMNCKIDKLLFIENNDSPKSSNHYTNGSATKNAVIRTDELVKNYNLHQRK